MDTLSSDEIAMAVYGTLRKGHHNHRYLAKSKYINTGKTKDKYTMTVSGRIPFVNKEPNTQITVELYHVNKKDLKPIDQLEGHPNAYRREEIDVLIGKNTCKAWLYFYEHPTNFKEIKDGDYNRYTKSEY